MFKRRAPASAAEPAYEGMCESLNARGTHRLLLGVEFPPGVWVPLSTPMANQLQWADGLTIRPKEASDA